MTRRICITGPESTGKTTLSQSLARKFGCPWVPEYARSFLQELRRPYEEEDLLLILKGQLKSEAKLLDPNRPFLFVDTGPEVIWVWSRYCFGRVAPEVDKITRSHVYDYTLLLNIDLPWSPDPLRENPKKEDRTKLLFLYQNLLGTLDHPYSLVSGSGGEREKTATRILRASFPSR